MKNIMEDVPQPWRVEDLGVIVDANGDLVARLAGRLNLDDAESCRVIANKLAAAGEMEAALAEMLFNFKRPHRAEWLSETGFERAINACAAAERALAKARGES